jgi:hypothetical protein
MFQHLNGSFEHLIVGFAKKLLFSSVHVIVEQPLVGLTKNSVFVYFSASQCSY